VVTLQDWDIVVDLGPMTLRDTLGDPDHVATLLLLQLQQRVEHPVVELLQERVDVQLHLVLEELVLEGLLAGVGAGPLEALLVLAVVFCNLSHLVVIVGSSQRLESVGVEAATHRVQLLTVVLGELGSERVDCDDKRPPVCLEGEDLAHDVRGLPADVLTETVERLEI